MALQSSGAISIYDIAAEFGGTVPHGLYEYYGAASGIPSSGPIGLFDFYGASSNLVATLTIALPDNNTRSYNVVASRGSLTPDMFEGYRVIIIEATRSIFKESYIYGGKISIQNTSGGAAPPDDLWSTLYFHGSNKTLARTTYFPNSSINSNNSSVRDWGHGSSAELWNAIAFNSTQTITMNP